MCIFCINHFNRQQLVTSYRGSLRYWVCAKFAQTEDSKSYGTADFRVKDMELGALETLRHKKKDHNGSNIFHLAFLGTIRNSRIVHTHIFCAHTHICSAHMYAHKTSSGKSTKKSHICKHMREKVQNILVFLPKTCIFTKKNVTLQQFSNGWWLRCIP